MVDIAVTVRYDNPTYLQGYTREFIKTYVNNINSTVPKYAPRFEQEFQKLHESKNFVGVKHRALPPDYTGSQYESIGTEFSPLKPLSQKTQTILKVGYLPSHFRGRMREYVPSIEAGWGTLGGIQRKSNRSKKLSRTDNAKTIKTSREGFSTPAGKKRLASLKDKANIEKFNKPFTIITPEGYKVTKRESGPRLPEYFLRDRRKREKRINPRKSNFDLRIEQWARDRLGIIPPRANKKKLNEAERTALKRLYFLKESIRQGAQGREILPTFARSGAEAALWNKINNEIVRNLNRSFTGVPSKKVLTRNFVARGAT